jgi:hypothetical protein
MRIKVGDLVKVWKREGHPAHPTLSNPSRGRRGSGIVVDKLKNLVYVLWETGRPKPIAERLLEVINEEVFSDDVGSFPTEQVSNNVGSLSKNGGRYNESR